MLEQRKQASSEPRAPGGSKRPAAFDLKGTMAPLTVLRLRVTDVVLVERQLRVKIAQLPQLFIDAPVLLDLGALGDDAAALLARPARHGPEAVQARPRRGVDRP